MTETKNIICTDKGRERNQRLVLESATEPRGTVPFILEYD